MKKKVGIAVQLNRESAHAVKWAVSNCVGPHDTVTLIHVKPTQSFHGADWGNKSRSVRDPSEEEETPAIALRRLGFSAGSEANPIAKDESLLHGFRSQQGADRLLEPLQQANVPYALHIVPDRDEIERICLEAQRLKLDALIICRGRSSSSSPSSPHTSVADYCIDHCDCPVIVVPYDDDDNEDEDGDGDEDAGDEDADDADDQRLSTSSSKL